MTSTRLRIAAALALPCLVPLHVTAEGATRPAGRLALASYLGDHWSIQLADADGSRLRTVPSIWALDPAFSPDGRRLAYADSRNKTSPGSTIVLARADGSGRTPLVLPGRYFVRGPSWSPDGRQLVYGWDTRQQLLAPRSSGVTASSWSCGLDVYDLRTNALRELIAVGGWGDADTPLGWAGALSGCPVMPKWSPRGDLIAFTVSQEAWESATPPNAPVEDPQSGTLATVHPDGSGLSLLVRSRAEYGIDFSPDGSRIAYGFCDRPETRGTEELHTVALDGSDDRVVAAMPTGTSAGFPTYSPDGRSILASVWDSHINHGYGVLQRFDVLTGARQTVLARSGNHLITADWHR